MAPPPVRPHNNSNPMTASDSENISPLSIDTSLAELLKIARQYKVDKNIAQAKLKHLSHKFGDITNDGDNNDNDNDNGGSDGDNNNNSTYKHKHKRQRNRHESPPAGSDEEEMGPGDVADEHFVYHAGHKFLLTCAPWIRSGDDLFNIDIDEHYNAAERFENDKNKKQGQLKEIINLLQGKFQQQALRQRWLQRQFTNGLNTQQYNMATRIHHNCASILSASEDNLLEPNTRKTRFREEIGWESETGLYSTINVPILHKGWHGEYSLASVFLNPKLMGIYVALIRGPVAGKYFMKGGSVRNQTETMARIHDICNITPGAIATCGVLARWVLSSDNTLQEVGLSTGIRYLKDYEEYLTILTTVLRQRKKSIINIFKQWDDKVFPDSESSLVKGKKHDDGSSLKKAMDLLAADSAEEDELEEEDNQMED